MDVVADLKTAYEKFKSGNAQAPVYYQKIDSLKVINGVVKGVMSKEVVDRDGEIVDIDGIDITNFAKNPVFLDSHYMHGSVVDTMLGKFMNIRKEMSEDGVKQLSGDIDFAPTPRGQLAKQLVEGGYAKTLSIGFSIKDYNFDERRIMQSELYECSLVNVPSNTEAEIYKGLNKNDGKSVRDIAKALIYYKKNKPVLKEYRRLFAKDLASKLGVEKTESELIDIKTIYDLILEKCENRSVIVDTTPQLKPLTHEQKVLVVLNALKQAYKK